ncbi:putative carboxylesterase 8 [Primulina tabacum]|uniref:putative carboxylesterase 8 n=1 Tax=Primulina tabacum TaxID=48773 RepID=UPI003F5A82CF
MMTMASKSTFNLLHLLWLQIFKQTTMSSEQQTAPTLPSMKDAYKFLNLVPNPDGTLTRPDIPSVPTYPDQTLYRDIPLNPTNATFIRLYRPSTAPPNSKLPIVVYFHGGGFVIVSATSSVIHEFCTEIAEQASALVASLEYRLAPEHRLPAAYEDGVEAISWVKTQATIDGEDGACEPWMKQYADFSRVFVMGGSAGGNLVYHACLRALDLDLQPLKIVALVMNQPFFGGLRRTESELKFFDNHVIPLHATDLLWSLVLPEDTDRGHEYCDPTTKGSRDGNIGRLPVCLVRGYAGDPLIDKQKEFAKMLDSRGVHVIGQWIDGGHHGVEIYDPVVARALYHDFKVFICSFQAA